MIKNLPGEEWRCVPGVASYYQVSNKGRIKTVPYVDCAGRSRKERLGQQLNTKAQIRIRTEDGERKSVYFPSLILRAFVGPMPSNCSLSRHLDDNRLNNKLENLAWGNGKDNHADAVKNGCAGIGGLHSDETKRKISLAFKKIWKARGGLSDTNKAALVEGRHKWLAAKGYKLSVAHGAAISKGRHRAKEARRAKRNA